MHVLVYMIELAVMLAVQILLGCLAADIMRHKGYRTNWFWLGFFFGLIAVIIAYLRPYAPGAYPSQKKYDDTKSEEQLMKNGGWKCSCGNVNPSYTGTCSCGNTKSNVPNNCEKQQ